MIKLKKIFATLLLVAPMCGVMAQTKLTREEYIDRYKTIAIDHQERYGIPASITMAQGLLESGNGNSLLASKSNNHFGIKCKSYWTGEKVYHDDDEKGECFRKYDSVEDSYLDHATFLDSSPRYNDLFSLADTDYKGWAKGLKAAGYATAPDYAERLIKIIEDNKLYLLDQQGGDTKYADATTVVVPQTESKPNTTEQAAGAEDGIDPNNYVITINAHEGYKVYLTNGVHFIRAAEGDSYERLGKLFAIAPNHLRKFNEVDKSATIATNDRIYIERKAKTWSGKTQTVEVKKGQTIHQISQLYGVRVKTLRKLNKLGKDVEVTPEMKIIIK